MSSLRDKIGMAILIIIILVFAIGGYFFMDYMTNEDKTLVKTKDNDVLDLRMDKNKDFIYYENSEELSHELIIEDAVINISGLDSINNTLHSELVSINNSKELYSNQELPDGVTCDGDIFKMNYRDYQDFSYSKYLTLLVNDYNYSCLSGNIPVNRKSYVVDKETGKIISEEELLQIFNITDNQIYDSIKKRLENTQTLDEDNQVIDINGTLEYLKNGSYGVNKALSVSKNGKLTINFIVKSNKINYNDSVEIN